MLRIFALALLLAAALPWPAGYAFAGAPAGPAILTVAGAVGKPNRPAFDPFDDAFLKSQEQSFTTAVAFDRAALAALPQVEVTAMSENWPRKVTAKGPRLGDVLAAAGVAPGATVTFHALDGYAVTMDAAQREAADWVLATEADGKPLGIGGRGPLWLVRDTGGQTITTGAEAQFVWALFLITTE